MALPHPEGAMPRDGVDPAENTRPLTLGEYRVGLLFNPGGSGLVHDLKARAAEFIDACEDMRQDRGAPIEVQRLVSLAQTAMEEAAMWAVKAATKPGR